MPYINSTVNCFNDIHVEHRYLKLVGRSHRARSAKLNTNNSSCKAFKMPRQVFFKAKLSIKLILNPPNVNQVAQARIKLNPY